MAKELKELESIPVSASGYRLRSAQATPTGATVQTPTPAPSTTPSQQQQTPSSAQTKKFVHSPLTFIDLQSGAASSRGSSAGYPKRTSGITYEHIRVRFRSRASAGTAHRRRAVLRPERCAAATCTY